MGELTEADSPLTMSLAETLAAEMEFVAVQVYLPASFRLTFRILNMLVASSVRSLTRGSDTGEPSFSHENVTFVPSSAEQNIWKREPIGRSEEDIRSSTITSENNNISFDLLFPFEFHLFSSCSSSSFLKHHQHKIGPSLIRAWLQRESVR